jgi:hypothetical protein
MLASFDCPRRLIDGPAVRESGFLRPEKSSRIGGESIRHERRFRLEVNQIDIPREHLPRFECFNGQLNSSSLGASKLAPRVEETG